MSENLTSDAEARDFVVKCAAGPDLFSPDEHALAYAYAQLLAAREALRIWATAEPEQTHGNMIYLRDHDRFEEPLRITRACLPEHAGEDGDARP